MGQLHFRDLDWVERCDFTRIMGLEDSKIEPPAKGHRS